MKKRNKIIYWIATIWLSLGMLSSGVVQVLSLKEEVAFILELGIRLLYKLAWYWKILGW